MNHRRHKGSGASHNFKEKCLYFYAVTKREDNFFRTKWAILQSDFNDLNIPELIFANLLESHKNGLHFFFSMVNWFMPNLKAQHASQCYLCLIYQLASNQSVE